MRGFQIKSVIICISSLAILAAVIFSSAKFYNQNREYSTLESATYGALNRAVWSIGIVGIIFVATCGSVPLLHEILSWKMWIPFSKLTYAAFIIHFQFQLRTVAMATSPIDFSMSKMVSHYVMFCKCCKTNSLLDTTRSGRLRLRICSWIDFIPYCRDAFQEDSKYLSFCQKNKNQDVRVKR